MEHPYLFLPKILSLFGLEAWSYTWLHIIYAWLVMAILIVLGLAGTRKLTMVPGKVQNLCEVAVGGLEKFMVDVTGEEGRWLFPVAATIFLYVLVGNSLGLIPGFYPPTANLNTTLSCALIVFVLTHVIGIKYHGAKYIKHFLGPMWFMAPFFLFLETISHLARVLSLSFRLFGNMMGHELVLAILFALAGAFLAPLPIMFLGVLVALVQALVFFLLSVSYFAGAMQPAH